MERRTIISFVILSLLKYSDGQMRCMQCTDIPLPRVCNTVQTCAANEVCYVDKVTRSGHHLFNSGCVAKSHCQEVVPVGKRATDARDCCHSDYCNLEGFGLTDLPRSLRGPHCFANSYAVDVGLTTHVTTCAKTEICSVSQVTIPGSSDVFYAQQCTPKASCTDIHQHTSCDGSCCETDFCNDRCAQYFTLAPTLSYNDLLRTECLKHINDGYFYDTTSNLCVHIVKSHGLFNRAQAEQQCKAEGGDLMTIQTEDEQFFLLTWIFSHKANDTDFWIGAKTHVSKSHTYYWPDGSPLTGYNHWSGIMMGQPDDRRTKNENCVFLNDKDRYFWHDDECSVKKTGFMCEIWNITGDKVSLCRQHLFDGFFYDSENDICVLFRETRLPQFTHSVAEAECNKFGASLAILDTPNKMDFTLKWIFSNHENATDFWIGAKDIHNTSEFYWPNGKKLDYSHWGGPVFPPELHGQPDALYGVTDQRCVYMDYHHSYFWFDESCSAKKTGFICQYFGANDNETRSECRKRLTQGYFYDEYTGMCVKLKTHRSVDEAHARQVCTSEKSDLVVIDSQDKMDFLLTWIFFHKENGSDFWIGGVDPTGQNHFSWRHTGHPFGYTHWYTITPPKPRDCVVLDHIDVYRWKTAECDSRTHGYICQINQRTLECRMSRADIVYILDQSGSEGAFLFDKIKDVISNVTRMLLQDSLDVKFAAIKFSTDVTEEFRLDSFTDMNNILTAIQNITYGSGTSRTDKALLYARIYSLTDKQGARSDSKKIAVVLSDGGSNNPTETVRQAKLLQAEAEVIAVGVGPQSSVQTTSMNAIASKNVTIALNANDIFKAVTDLLKDPNNSNC